MKKLIVMILFCTLFVLPVNVHALTGKTEITCSKVSLTPGETTTCTLKGNVTDDEVTGIEAMLTTSTNLSITKVTADSIWDGNGENGDIKLYTDINKTGTFPIATFTIQAKSSVTNGSDENIKLTSTEFSDKAFKEHEISDNSLNIRIKSTVNTLSSLKLSAGTLSPAFNSNTLNYSLTLNAEKVTISATKTDTKSTVSGNVGEVKLNYGINTFKVNVTSESSVVKTYTITITRPDNRDKDNTISSLTLNGNKITLSSSKTEYSYEVESDVNELDIESTLTSDKAKFVDNYEPRTVNLVEGENRLELKVMAENESIKTYTLIVTRKKAVVPTPDTNKDQSQSTPNNNVTNNGASNPKTGSLAIYIVSLIVIISGGLGFFFYKKYQKKQVNGSNEER